jgi:phage shock protein A
VETSDAFVRFGALENKIERMEAEADLVNAGRRNALEEEFDRMLDDEDLQKELSALKTSMGKKNSTQPGAGEGA